MFEGIIRYPIFAYINLCEMDYAKKPQRHTARCLECGDAIAYGRSDKKFCCDDCRNRHHNHQARAGRSFRRRVMAVLEKNYEVLEACLRAGVDSLSLSEAAAMGFVTSYATAFRKSRNRIVYECFDICYVMTPSRLYSISKIQNLSLTLQIGLNADSNKYR